MHIFCLSEEQKPGVCINHKQHGAYSWPPPGVLNDNEFLLQEKKKRETERREEGGTVNETK